MPAQGASGVLNAMCGSSMSLHEQMRTVEITSVESLKVLRILLLDAVLLL